MVEPSRDVPILLPDAATLAGYDRWAASYDATTNPMVQATAVALRERAFDVAGADVVEFGCGTGRHAPDLLAAGARSYTGIDGSAGMLEVAARRRVPRAAWVRGTLDTTPFADAGFDRALLVLVLEHLADPGPCCRELGRVLRRGGALRVLEIHPDLVAHGTGAHFDDGGTEVRFTSHCHPTTTIVAALRSGGLTAIDRRELVADDALVAQVPKLGKHRGRTVLLDLLARRD